MPLTETPPRCWQRRSGSVGGHRCDGVYRLEPDRLPDPRRPGVEPFDFSFQYCLPRGWSRLDLGLRPALHDVSRLRPRGRASRRRRMACVRPRGSYLRTVHPDRRAVVTAPKWSRTLVARRRVLEGAGVPDDIVEGRLPDAGELRLVAVGDDYLPVERRVTGAQVLEGDALPAVGEADIGIVECEAPLAVQIRPVPAAQLRAWVLGSRRRIRYGPFLLEARAIRSTGPGRRSASSSKGLVALRFRPGQLEPQDVNKQALEVLQAFRSIVYLPREEVFIQAVGGERS